MVNEIAPRVHNSGHWTEAACLIDQFEQHVRAICGWPLGDGARHSDAEMVNLIGDEAAAAPEIAGARVHLYGKAEARPGRKMGHVDPHRAANAVSGPRLAVRAVILDRGRVLLVNAYPGEESDLWCAPGGGAERGQSLADNLRREVREETGLAIEPGRLLAVSEFHNPGDGFHQVDLIYAAPARRRGGRARCCATRRGWSTGCAGSTPASCRGAAFKPDCLARLAFGPEGPVVYDPLETLVR